MPGGFRTALLTLLSILWALFPAAAAGQEAPPPDPIDIVDRGLPIPDGFWQDNVAQQRASLFGIRPAITIRSWETNPWGLRARLAIQFAGLDFRSPEGVDLEKVSLAGARSFARSWTSASARAPGSTTPRSSWPAAASRNLSSPPAASS
ncbi:MAG: hypothetical protein P8Y07_05000 [Gemmatimonadales bacterium]